MKSKLIKPENTLKKKAGNGGFNESDLVKAQNMIQTNEIDFRPLAHDLLKELNDILSGIKTGDIKSDEYFDKLMYPLMQLKSQGALFRYPSVTKISQILLDLLENAKAIDDNVLDIIAAYTKSLNAMLMLQAKEENNKITQEFCNALLSACDRYFKFMDKQMSGA